MDFAKNLMKKYGWEEGTGLGKNNEGKVKPLKANYKFDKSGLGLDKAADFNNHWWERIYNDAANNLEVKNDGKVGIDVKSLEGLEISTKEYSTNKLKRLRGSNTYNNFCKSSILSASIEKEHPNRLDIDVIGLPKYKSLTDDELFAACGGRTAHKGARHGLKLSGKLARIEQQEIELLRKDQVQSIPDNNFIDWEIASEKKSKRKRKTEELEQSDEEKTEDKLKTLLDNSEYTTKSKKKRKEKRKLENDLSLCLDRCSLINESNDGNVLDPAFVVIKDLECKKNKKKKRKNKNKKFSIETKAEKKFNENEVFEELEDQLTVNSLDVNVSDSEQTRPQHKKSGRSKRKERKLMSKLTDSLMHSVVIGD